MGFVLPPIEAYQVQHLPIVKAYADKIGLVDAINAVVPTEMGVDPGTIVLGMILDTLSGRSPLYRLEEFFTHQDTARLLGQVVAPAAFNDDTVGRILERLYAVGTMKISLNLSHFVARQIWGRRGVSPLRGMAHRLQRREPLRGLLVLMHPTFDLLQTAIN